VISSAVSHGAEFGAHGQQEPIHTQAIFRKWDLLQSLRFTILDFCMVQCRLTEEVRARPVACHKRRFMTRNGRPPNQLSLAIELPVPSVDAGADQRLVDDVVAGEADQDRREGCQPCALCRVPDGRGSGSEKSVRGDSSHDRGTEAATSHIDRLVGSGVACLIENDGKGASERQEIREFSYAAIRQCVRTVVQAGGIGPSLPKSKRCSRLGLLPAAHMENVGQKSIGFRGSIG